MSIAPPERDGSHRAAPGSSGHGAPGTSSESIDRDDGDAASSPRASIVRTGPDLERLLARVKRDLERLPRHEWDTYLWNLCSALVRTHAGTRHAPACADHDPSANDP
ncbi:MAG TPA: hypothetical protein VIL43_11900 [Burkholderiales bacterium]